MAQPGRLGRSEQAVFRVLLSAERPDLSLREIALRAGLSQRTVARAKTHLHAAGLITWQREYHTGFRHNGQHWLAQTPNVYRIKPPHEWPRESLCRATPPG